MMHGGVFIVPLASPQQTILLDCKSNESIDGLALRADGARLFALERAGAIVSWTLPVDTSCLSGTKIRQPDGFDSKDPDISIDEEVPPPRGICLSATGEYLAFFDASKGIAESFRVSEEAVCLGSLETGEKDVVVRNLAFHPYYDSVVGACSDNWVRAWAPASPEAPRWLFQEEGCRWPSAIVPEEKRLLLWRAWFDRDGTRLFTNSLARYLDAEGNRVGVAEEIFQVRTLGQQPGGDEVWGWRDLRSGQDRDVLDARLTTDLPGLSDDLNAALKRYILDFFHRRQQT